VCFFKIGTLSPFNVSKSDFWTPTDFSNIKMPSPYPKLSLGNTRMLSFCRSGMMGNFFMIDVSKNWIFGQKKTFLAPKRVILGNLDQKRPAKGPDVVLPEIQSYPEIAWDMGMIFRCWRSPENGGVWL